MVSSRSLFCLLSFLLWCIWLLVWLNQVCFYFNSLKIFRSSIADMGSTSICSPRKYGIKQQLGFEAWSSLSQSNLVQSKNYREVYSHSWF
ncbi:unnamed protein product [Prunus armeniaca]|uniref:Uncharacterized protein n=1 Tax=Prunus armeniaca TaxID=36596 RepID=A0A6J5YAP3_PRUAR|nr:unnamed protein product [Prunus armeniaca]